MSLSWRDDAVTIAEESHVIYSKMMVMLGA